MKSSRTDGNFIISLLIKIQLWSGTRTTLTRFKDFIYTQYYGQISEPQKISTTSKLALPTVFKIQDFSLTWLGFIGSVSLNVCTSCFFFWLGINAQTAHRGDDDCLIT